MNDSLINLKSKWLNTINIHRNKNTQVILAGNRIGEQYGESYEILNNNMNELVNETPFIITNIECTSMSYKSTSDLFF